MNCGTSGTSGTSETSGTGGTGGKVYAKEVAKCVYEQLNKSTDVEETLEKLAEKMNNKSIYRIIYKSYV